MRATSPFAEGVRLGVGPGAATCVLGLSFGAAASIEGWGLTVPVLFSMFAFSGSAQFALLTTLPTGSAAAAVAAAVLINARCRSRPWRTGRSPWPTAEAAASTSPPPELLHDLGADVVFPAFFLMLALDEVRRSPRALVGAVCGATIAAALLFVTEPGYALLAATSGALVGARPGRQDTESGGRR